MASFDPYAPCPCGSGEKFKWCCQKVEAYAEKAIRLFEGGQTDAALAALDDGLSRDPGNVWLTIRKALILGELDRSTEARDLVDAVVQKNPKHLSAQALLIRLRLETEGIKLASDQLQNALTNVASEQRPKLAPVINMLGVVLARTGAAPAARKHLELAARLSPDSEVEMLSSVLSTLDSSPSIPPWLRDDLRLAQTVAGTPDSQRQEFEQALGYADQGLWSTAAAGFDRLSGWGVAGADRNLGLCRLWLMDLPGAVDALRRASRSMGVCEEAVDLECLCQTIDQPSTDQVEQVHLIWTLRDRERLLEALRASDRADAEGEEPLDPDDPGTFPVEVFSILDRPRIGRERLEAPLEATSRWPKVLGRALVGREIAMLETYDDGRLDDLSSWFTTLAGPALPPAQPRTKILGRVGRAELAMRTELWVPDELSPEQSRQLQRLELTRIIGEVWPRLPSPYLGGRSPEEAARSGGFEVPLRAGLLRFEVGSVVRDLAVDLPGLRARLGLDAEPKPDPATVDIDGLTLARLQFVDPSRLDDDRLEALYRRSTRTGMMRALEQASRAIIDRPAMLERRGIGHVGPYANLSFLSLVGEGNRATAQTWLDRGRQADPQARTTNAVSWDFHDLQIRSSFEEPASWVPHLAVLLDRYRDNREAMPVVIQNLSELGLVRLVAHPDDPRQMMLDSRALQAMLAEYGPRITTAAGTLGVSASQGGIWTPEQSTGGGSSGGLWTPGASPPPGPGPSGDKPRIIIPGR